MAAARAIAKAELKAKLAIIVMKKVAADRHSVPVADGHSGLMLEMADENRHAEPWTSCLGRRITMRQDLRRQGSHYLFCVLHSIARGRRETRIIALYLPGPVETCREAKTCRPIGKRRDNQHFACGCAASGSASRITSSMPVQCKVFEFRPSLYGYGVVSTRQLPALTPINGHVRISREVRFP